eukprot:2659704-Pleurochrysis_carterae.AAC.1
MSRHCHRTCATIRKDVVFHDVKSVKNTYSDNSQTLMCIKTQRRGIDETLDAVDVIAENSN